MSGLFQNCKEALHPNMPNMKPYRVSYPTIRCLVDKDLHTGIQSSIKINTKVYIQYTHTYKNRTHIYIVIYNLLLSYHISPCSAGRARSSKVTRDSKRHAKDASFYRATTKGATKATKCQLELISLRCHLLGKWGFVAYTFVCSVKYIALVCNLRDTKQSQVWKS